jgi:serine/threonine protein phosphatase 1
MKTRTLVIGDIHGADLALQQAMERAKLTHRDTVICLGDYVDGWSGSSAVISRLIRLNETNECIFIKGNHDTWCEEWLDSEASNITWLYNGGESTLSSYDHFNRDEKQLHLRFFQRMRGYYIDGKNRLFLHAGFSSMHGPAHETYPSNFSWDRTLWEAALALDPALEKSSPYYPKRLKLFEEIYIGHTPTTNYGTDQPMNRASLWNIDTGAGFEGRVTVLDVDTKEFWQSDPVRTVYPKEKGRNRD